MSTPFKRVNDIYKSRAPFDPEGYVIYIINKELSKNPMLIDLINEMQRYALTPEQHFRVVSAFAPLTRRPGFKEFPWIWKGKEAATDEVEVVAKFYEESTQNAQEYVEILNQTKEGKEHIEWLMSIYGKKNKLKKVKSSHT